MFMQDEWNVAVEHIWHTGLEFDTCGLQPFQNEGCENEQINYIDHCLLIAYLVLR